MEAGVYKDISIDDYHKLYTNWFSSTGLRKAKKSLKLFKMLIDGKLPDEYKVEFDMGNVFELALLQSNEIETKVAFEQEIFDEIKKANPDSKMPRGTTMYKEWFEKQKKDNKYIVSPENWGVITEMLASCYADATINKLIKNIQYNVSIFWVDEETGLMLKTRPDIMKTSIISGENKNIVVNLKTTRDASPEAFFKDCANHDYPFQACMEMDGVLSSGLMERVDNYFWLVVEKEPPYSAQLYRFAKEDIEYCKDDYRYTLKTVKMAFDSGIFPSYSQRADNKYGVIDVKLPLWYRNNGV